MKKISMLFVVLATTIVMNAQKYEGLAETPPMGWSSWNTFADNINEEIIRGIADKMVELRGNIGMNFCLPCHSVVHARTEKY